MAPIYVVRKSAWRALTPLRILFFWLIIPLIVILVRVVQLKHEIIEFYPDKIIQKSGVIAKKEKRSSFTGVMGTSVDQGVLGRMLNYGDVRVDVAGKWDIDTEGVKAPRALQNFLESHLVQVNNFNTVNTLIG